MSSAPGGGRWALEVRSRLRADTAGAEVHLFGVHVPEDLACFRGHFVGDPILPAVMQLSTLVLRLVAETWPGLPPLRRVTRLKFRRPIRPGDDLTVRLERSGGVRRLSFTIEVGSEAAGLGTLEFGEHIDG